MTEPTADEREARQAAYAHFSRLAADWDYESWERQHLREKAGQLDWLDENEGRDESSTGQ